jgi:DNA-directed RNA polymerase subunit M/transcription elongation factor TFIIS
MSRRLLQVRENNIADLLGRIPPITIGFDHDGSAQMEYPLTTDEMNQLIELQTDNGEQLLNDRDMDAVYQFISMVIQLKYGKRLVNSNQTGLSIDQKEINADGEVMEEPEVLEEEGLLNSTSKKDISRTSLNADHSNNFQLIMKWLNSIPWVIPEEAVHESALMAGIRLKVAIQILELEQEPIVEEGSIVCQNRSCKSRKIITQYVQTRGNDEGFTAFHTCTNCGQHFKGS